MKIQKIFIGIKSYNKKKPDISPMSHWIKFSQSILTVQKCFMDNAWHTSFSVKWIVYIYKTPLNRIDMTNAIIRNDGIKYAASIGNNIGLWPHKTPNVSKFLSLVISVIIVR